MYQVTWIESNGQIDILMVINTPNFDTAHALFERMPLARMWSCKGHHQYRMI